MKTKDIAYGGLMIASFLALGMFFRTNARVVQTYLEIVKTIIVAISIRKMERNSCWIFAVACFLSCLIIIPIPDTIIYNVPSIIGGCVIGTQKNIDKKFRNFMCFFIVNSMLIIYEFLMFGFFMETNLFNLYSEQSTVLLSEIINVDIPDTYFKIVFIGFMILDSAFSSFVIFGLFQMINKKISGIKK